ncbi:hypothetical protein KBC89_02360 [Candidatus Woesebacteria bacterium]|nr:hypothetical protein [Candidatus Woesebacteria bacterium]
MSQLIAIDVVFPEVSDTFFNDLTHFLRDMGELRPQSLLFRTTKRSYYPQISLKEDAVEQPLARFSMDDGELSEVIIENSSGVKKKSQYAYTAITMTDFTARIQAVALQNIDHLGFNLPWFKTGVHPKITNLRDLLKSNCLYHTFPSGEPWDFILPGTQAEVEGTKPIDYIQIRKPKFEIVSFANCSKPLVQIDMAFATSYEKLARLFPEGILLPDIKSVWVYLQNPYNIDICLVLNKAKGDWSNFFRNSRIT